MIGVVTAASELASQFGRQRLRFTEVPENSSRQSRLQVPGAPRGPVFSLGLRPVGGVTGGVEEAEASPGAGTVEDVLSAGFAQEQTVVIMTAASSEATRRAKR